MSDKQKEREDWVGCGCSERPSEALSQPLAAPDVKLLGNALRGLRRWANSGREFQMEENPLGEFVLLTDVKAAIAPLAAAAPDMSREPQTFLPATSGSTATSGVWGHGGRQPISPDDWPPKAAPDVTKLTEAVSRIEKWGTELQDPKNPKCDPVCGQHLLACAVLVREALQKLPGTVEGK